MFMQGMYGVHLLPGHNGSRHVAAAAERTGEPAVWR